MIPLKSKTGRFLSKKYSSFDFLPTNFPIAMIPPKPKTGRFFIKTPVLTFFIHPLIFPNRRANVKPWPLCGKSGQLVQINAQFYSYKLMHNLHIGIPQVNAHCYSCKCISAGLGLTGWLFEANVCQMDMWPIKYYLRDRTQRDIFSFGS